MAKIWTVCSMELSRILKKKQSYLIMFVLPLIFTVIFGSFSSESTSTLAPIIVVDQDQTALSERLKVELQANNSLMTVKVGTAEEAEEQVANKEIAAAVIIQEGFQADMLANRNIELIFQKNPQYTESEAVKQYIQSQVVKMKKGVQAALSVKTLTGTNWEATMSILDNAEVTPMAVDVELLNVEESKSMETMQASGRASGFSIMFVMVMLMGVAGVFLESRKNGVWYRMLTTPASRLEIILGYLLAFFIIGWIQFASLLVATRLLFGFDWGNEVALFLLVSALLCSIIGLGLFIAGIVKTTEQQAAISNLVVVATCMVSGVYWPLEVEPGWMQRLAEWLPQTWAMNGMATLMTTGGGVMDIAQHIIVLLGFALLFLILGVRKIRFE